MAQAALTLSGDAAHASHVNPQWVRLLNLLEMNARYEHCSGVELKTGDGRTILDFLSGYCVHNAGHNHPEIITALKKSPANSGTWLCNIAGPLRSNSRVPCC